MYICTVLYCIALTCDAPPPLLFSAALHPALPQPCLPACPPPVPPQVCALLGWGSARGQLPGVRPPVAAGQPVGHHAGRPVGAQLQVRGTPRPCSLLPGPPCPLILVAHPAPSPSGLALPRILVASCHTRYPPAPRPLAWPRNHSTRQLGPGTTTPPSLALEPQHPPAWPRNHSTRQLGPGTTAPASLAPEPQHPPAWPRNHSTP